MKKNLPVVCNIVSAALVIVFVIKSIVDDAQYSPIENSAPFSAQALANVLYFMIPAGIVFVISAAVREKEL